MKRNEVFIAFAKKLNIGKAQLEKIFLTDGKVYLPYLQEVFTEIKKRLKENRENADLADEFSSRSANPWAYLNPDISVLTLARLLTLHSGRTSAKLRAECTKPRITEDILWSFLATQLETTVDKLNRNMRVRDIKLPLAGFEKHSWLTFVIWTDSVFGDGRLLEKPERADEIAEMSVREFFGFFLRQ